MFLRNVLTLAVMATSASSCLQGFDTERESMIAELQEQGALTTLYKWLSANRHLEKKNDSITAFTQTKVFKDFRMSFFSVKEGKARVFCFARPALTYFFSKVTPAQDLTKLSAGDAITLLLTQMHATYQEAQKASSNGRLEKMMQEARDNQASKNAVERLMMID